MTAENTNSVLRDPNTALADLPFQRCFPSEGLADLPPGSRVLVIRLRSMGDTILLTPALRMLHEWRPDLQISVLVDKPWDELLVGNPAIHQILVTSGKLSTLRAIRRAGFAAVVNLHGGPTSAQLTQFSGAPRRIGMAQFRSRSAYNVLVPRMQDILPMSAGGEKKGRVAPLPFHTAEHAAAVFGWLGMPLRMVPAAQLFPSAAARSSVHAKLGSWEIPTGAESGYALLHAAGLYPSKRWSPRGFADTGKWLAQEHQLRPVLLGGKADLPLLEEIQSAIGSAAEIAAGWPINEMLALIAGARIFLGNDSGPAHAAAALGVPVVAIFGSSSSTLWGPWRAAASAVVQNEFACNPCPGDRCREFGEPRCILSIESAQVRKAIEEVLRVAPSSAGGSHEA